MKKCWWKRDGTVEHSLCIRENKLEREAVSLVFVMSPNGAVKESQCVDRVETLCVCSYLNDCYCAQRLQTGQL